MFVLLAAGACDRGAAVDARDGSPSTAQSRTQSQVAAEASVPPAAVPSGELGPIHRLTVTDLDGKPVSLARFAGRPMIIEIWATWCGPCLANRKLVHALDKEIPERVAVIGLSVDASAGLVKTYLASNPANDFEGMAGDEFMAFVRTKNSSNLIPKTMYVDSKGRVVDLSEGTQSHKWLTAMAKNLK